MKPVSLYFFCPPFSFVLLKLSGHSPSEFICESPETRFSIQEKHSHLTCAAVIHGYLSQCGVWSFLGRGLQTEVVEREMGSNDRAIAGS